MASYNYIFSSGEIGVDQIMRYGSDRSLACLVIENMICDQQYVWYSRGGSEYLYSLGGVQEYISYKSAYLLKTNSKLYLYDNNILILEFSYTGTFNLSSLVGSVGKIESDSDGFDYGFGVFLAANLSQGVDYQNITGSITGFSNTVSFTSNGYFFVTVTNRKSLKKIELYSNSKLSGKQIVYARQFLNQLIFLTLDKDFVQQLIFISQVADGAASIDFTYTLLKGTSYNKVITTSDGFLLSGSYNIQRFFTSSNVATSIFKADNIRATEFYRSGCEILDCYQDIVIFKPTGENTLLVKNAISGSDYSEVYNPHSEVSIIEDIRAFDGSPVKFLVLFNDGSMDCLHCFRSDNNQLSIIISRLTFKTYIHDLINVYLNTIVYYAGNHISILRLGNPFCVDEYQKFLPLVVDPIDPIDPVIPPVIENKIVIEKSYTNGIIGYGILGAIQEAAQKPESPTVENIILDNEVNKYDLIVLKLNINFKSGDIGYTGKKTIYGSRFLSTVINISAIRTSKIIKLEIVEVFASRGNATGRPPETSTFTVGSTLVHTTSNPIGFANTYNTIVWVKTNGKDVEIIADPGFPRIAPDPYIPSNILSGMIVRRYDDHALITDTYSTENCYFGYIIEYKFVILDIVNQGNLMYGRNKDSLAVNMFMLGNRLRPLEVSFNNYYTIASFADDDYSQMDARINSIDVSIRKQTTVYKNSYFGNFSGFIRSSEYQIPFIGFGCRESMKICSANVIVDSAPARQLRG